LSLRGRIRSLFQAPRSLPAAIDELALAQNENLSARANLSAARRAIDAHTRALQVIHALCKALSQQREPVALARSFVMSLRTQLQIGGAVVRAELPGEKPALRELFGAGQREKPPALIVPLRLGERSIGCIDLFPPLPERLDAELLDEASTCSRSGSIAPSARPCSQTRPRRCARRSRTATRPSRT
jgi:hypothetical protein